MRACGDLKLKLKQLGATDVRLVYGEGSGDYFSSCMYKDCEIVAIGRGARNSLNKLIHAVETWKEPLDTQASATAHSETGHQDPCPGANGA